MATLDQASKEEVLLYRQLRCDAEGTHDLEIMTQIGMGTCTHVQCKVCNYETTIEDNQ